MATLNYLERVFTPSMPHEQKSTLLVIANMCIGKDSIRRKRRKSGLATKSKSNLET